MLPAVLVIAALVGVRLVEVALYDGAYTMGANVFALGELRGSGSDESVALLYFATET